MLKHIVSLCLLLVTILINLNAAEARVKKKRKTHKSYKISKHKRKSRHYKYSNGPDLKAITSDSPYTESSNNGVNSIETREPELSRPITN
jgi:hypothetical protein